MAKRAALLLALSFAALCLVPPLGMAESGTAPALLPLPPPAILSDLPNASPSMSDGAIRDLPLALTPADQEGVVLAGAIVPSTPIAPGQGPLFDDLGGEWDEQRRSPANRFWYARTLTATWLPKNGADGFGTTDVPITTSLAPVWFDDLPALLITPGFGFHCWQAPDALELPSTVFDASIDISWRTPITDRFGVGFGLTPGVYGDYRQYSSKAFQLTGWGLVDYRFSDTWTVVAGAAVVRQLDMRVLPVGGVIWTPSTDSRLELLVPRSRYVRKVKSFNNGGGAWIYTACQFGGGSWSVTLPDATTALVTISDLRAILGLEWFRSSSVAGVAEVGYVFARTISANRVPEFNPNDTLMLQAGATF
ncbi:MAG: hypothetical protein DWH79_00995 [Planctomycetota bacterium]|nr:MAG: hypothetical protein DWH79_00995 [Planctomycetota bacterium]